MRIRLRLRTNIGARRQVALGLCLLGLSSALPAAQTNYRLVSGDDSVIGQAFYVKTRHEDTLLDIGRHNGLGYDEMKHANRGVDMWVPGEGKDVLVPTQFVLPSAPRQGVVLNLAEKRLYHFPSTGEVVTYAISIGREGWSTPLGSFRIVRKDKDPAWYPPASIRKEHAAEGRPLPAVVPAGPDNPLGQHALRLSAKGYLIHGTNKPWGLGMQVSHGCIRMYPEDIEQLFPKVQVKTPVTIVNQPYKVGWRGDDLYLEVHAKEGDETKPPTAVIPPAVANAEGVNVDWEEVQKAVAQNTGLPHLVGGRQRPANWLYLDMIF
ncbi:MAG: L,D-transpeptidase family protein [Pseudomonadota bacterium]|nr:L,D-transpeptidase family protein [Pseudomonadota bacterium]